MTKLATKVGKILPQGVGMPICADKRGHPGWTLPSSFGRSLGLPELAVEHNFFEMVVIQVCRGAENRIRARLRLGLGKEGRDRHSKELGQPLQIGNGRLVGSGFQGEIVLAVAFTAGGFVLDRAAAPRAAQIPTPSPYCQRNDRETVQPLGKGDAE
jgi:hypothetical protein